jgi:hypothetical protein
MRIRGIVWLREVVDKLAVKHRVEPHEVEEVLAIITPPNFALLKRASATERMCTSTKKMIPRINQIANRRESHLRSLSIRRCEKRSQPLSGHDHSVKQCEESDIAIACLNNSSVFDALNHAPLFPISRCHVLRSALDRRRAAGQVPRLWPQPSARG